MAAAAAAGAASSIFSSATAPRRVPSPPAPARKPVAAAGPRALAPPPHRLLRLPCPPASCAPAPPPEGAESERPDPVKLAFARAAAYKKERDSPAAAAPPPPPQAAVAEPGSKEAFKRALESRNGNGAGAGGAGGGDSPVLGGSLDFGQNALLSEDVTFGNKKAEYEFDETDFLGLDFFEKKRYKGPPPGLAPAFEPLSDDNFPEVEIIVGDPSKFRKSRQSTEIQPVSNRESEETPKSTSEPNEADKIGKTPPSTVIEPEEDEDGDVYRPTVRSWGMFPRPQNISKAYGGGRNIQLGGETLSAEEKAAKDKRTKELIAAYRNRQNVVIDAKTKAECDEALREGDEMMNTGRLKQALPYYEKVMNAVDFKFGLTIKAVQCDNGREFDNNASRSFFLTRGVQLRMSCPYTSAQNGKAERMIRTTNDVMRTLRSPLPLPARFGAESLHTTYLLNRLPSTASPAPTPHHHSSNPARPRWSAGSTSLSMA
ncbi:hypothetical protein U9M48_043773 [Paspalum notatum var. saurae]|uniref:Integrase catalytic domain-containing protein n=1 Tax=Paspalum notatum var. saurae TaxID=547442 RepID=A0AAQ3UTS3_PASNO